MNHLGITGSAMKAITFMKVLKK